MKQPVRIAAGLAALAAGLLLAFATPLARSQVRCRSSPPSADRHGRGRCQQHGVVPRSIFRSRDGLPGHAPGRPGR